MYSRCRGKIDMVSELKDLEVKDHESQLYQTPRLFLKQIIFSIPLPIWRKSIDKMAYLYSHFLCPKFNIKEECRESD